MSQTTAMIGISSEELRWIRMLVALLRHSDPTLPELARQALLYLSQSAGEPVVPVLPSGPASAAPGPRPIRYCPESCEIIRNEIMDRVSQGHGARILVHGHRGARGRMPENTLAAFHYAIGCGVDAIEMDLVLTGDGQVVISHDPVLHAAAEPSLDDVFRLASMGGFAYDVEIKWRVLAEPDAFVECVLDKIRQWHLEARVTILSFDFRVLRVLRKLAPQIRLAALTDGDPRAFSVIAKEAANAETIAPELHLVTREKVGAAHAAALKVVPWTVNAPRDWDAMIAAGVDGIITDDPAALIAHLQARGLR